MSEIISNQKLEKAKIEELTKGELKQTDENGKLGYLVGKKYY